MVKTKHCAIANPKIILTVNYSKTTSSVILAIMMGFCLQSFGGIEVRFNEAECFKDVKVSRSGSEQERNEVLSDIGDYMVDRLSKEFGETYLVVIEVYQLDLAGEFEPSGELGSNVRVLKEIYPPSIELEYAIFDRNGTELLSGRDELVQRSFFPIQSTLIQRNHPFVKRLFNEWVKSLDL